MSAQLGRARVRDDSAMNHLMSAQRGKSTLRVISALDCPLTSAPREVLHALLHVNFHAILAHEDVDKIHDFPRIVDRRQSGEGAPLEREVAPDKLGIDKLNGRAIDSESVVCQWRNVWSPQLHHRASGPSD